MQPAASGYKDRIQVGNFPTYCGIPAGKEEIVGDGKLVDVEALLGLRLEEVQTDNESSFKFTFKSATAVVEYVINRGTRLTDKTWFPLACPLMGGELLKAIKTIKAENQNWLDLILQMLVEKKQIKSYDIEGEKYWIELK